MRNIIEDLDRFSIVSCVDLVANKGLTFKQKCEIEKYLDIFIETVTQSDLDSDIDDIITNEIYNTPSKNSYRKISSTITITGFEKTYCALERIKSITGDDNYLLMLRLKFNGIPDNVMMSRMIERNKAIKDVFERHCDPNFLTLDAFERLGH